MEGSSRRFPRRRRMFASRRGDRWSVIARGSPDDEQNSDCCVCRPARRRLRVQGRNVAAVQSRGRATRLVPAEGPAISRGSGQAGEGAARAGTVEAADGGAEAPPSGRGAQGGGSGEAGGQTAGRY